MDRAINSTQMRVAEPLHSNLAMLSTANVSVETGDPDNLEAEQRSRKSERGIC